MTTTATRSTPRCCAAARDDNRRLRSRVRSLQADNQRLERESENQREKIKCLEGQLEKQRRAGKRQAAPFSKGAPKAQPRTPGRRAGPDYGRKAQRPVPEHVDEVVDVPLPACCPDCQGVIEETGQQAQYQSDLPIPIRPRVTRFDIRIGRCNGCGKRVQGRHPRQSSNALGAARSSLGPNALVVAADLNKGLGLSFEKVARLFDDFFGLSVTRGGLCGAVARVGRAAEPTYDAMAGWMRKASVVSPDETGWRVGGRSAWLWAFVSHELTLYTIAPGRGFDVAAAVLGENFSGTLARDGWAPYRSFKHAWHQTCLAHLLRRCKENLETAMRGLARVPRAVERILKSALDLRDRRDAGQISGHGLLIATGQIRAKMDRLLEWKPKDRENAKLLAHLKRERECDALFTFLLDPEVPATNFWSEQAIRPAVVTRKVWGGESHLERRPHPGDPGEHTQE